jgi:phage FluMu gp28-like protein
VTKEILKALEAARWKPHPGQREFLDCPARFRVLACGRRWGKTDAAAAEIAALVVERASSRQIAIAPTIAQARIVFDRALWFLTALGVSHTATATPHPAIKVHEGKDKKAPAIHIVDARSGFDAKFLRGQGADHVLIDEAAFVPESLITEVAMPMLAANDGRMSLISTPLGRNHFFKFYRMGERRQNEFWSRNSPSEENPRVSREYLELQREILPERSFRIEYLAHFLDSQRSVFSAEAIDEALDAPIVERGAVVVGVDWGRYRDYTAVVAVRGKSNRAEVIACDRWSQMRYHSLAVKVAAFAKSVGAKRIVCDATGGGDPITEILQTEFADLSIETFTFTRSSKTEIIESLASTLERGHVRLLGDTALIRELECFEASTTDEGHTRYAAPEGSHDDLVCALALACSGVPRSGGLGLLTKPRR